MTDTAIAGLRRGSRPAPKPLLSVEQTAVLLGESRSAIYRSIERGDLPLPVFHINGRLRIPRRAVERLIEGEAPLESESALALVASGGQSSSSPT